MATNLDPTTTLQEDITTARQQRINLIWEFTQAIIAVLVVIANMTVEIAIGLNFARPETRTTVLSNALFLVVGFYFSRTNHQQIGGIGKKRTDTEVYQGR